jgi:iron complex outermembrane receptor protein
MPAEGLVRKIGSRASSLPSHRLPWEMFDGPAMLFSLGFVWRRRLGLLLLWPGLAAAESPAGKLHGKTVEKVIVRAPSHSATGVTGVAPGGGLITEETAAVSRSTVSVDFIAKQAPTSNAFELLRLSPGANVSTSDPYGLSPSVNISVRGLNGDEVAYLVEGAPLNDIGYYAGYPSQWADSENITTVALQQGTVDLDTPTINAGGGLVSLTLHDPLSTPGGLISGSYGSYHENREFLRLDTGLLAGTNLRGFVSFSNTEADNYRGPGRDHRTHVDFKFVDEWSDGNRVAVAGSYHDAVLSSYPMPSLVDWKAFGRSNNYDASFSPGDTNYWKLYQQSFRDVQVSVPSHFTLTEGLSFESTPYFEHGFGNSPYGAVLPATGLYLGTQPVGGQVRIPNARNGQALVLADYIGNQYRAGATNELIATLGANRLVAGWWYDYADDYDPQPFTPVGASGEPSSVWGFPYTIKLPDGRNLSAQEAHTREQANVLFMGDTITLLDGKLKIDAGLKYAMVNREGTNDLPGPQYRVGLDSAQPLPRAAIRYDLDKKSQVFASVSTNFRSATEYVLYNTYDVFGDQVTKGASQRDEYAISEEIGYRYQSEWLDGSVSFFNYNFTNRQVSTLVNGVIGSSINAGGQTSRGVDAEIGLLPVRHWRPYVSGEYLHATIDNNFAVNGDYLPTAGKIAVRSPAFQGALGLDYDNGTYFGNVAGKYVGSQYATFLDDERIPSHAQADATLGFRLPDYGFVKKPEARLNLINLTDARFLSGVAAVAPNAHDAVGVHGTPIGGAPPSYYIGPGFAAVVTLASAF